MDTLQHQIANCFPDAYSPETWKELIPQFIADQLERYNGQIDIHEKELALWETGDQSTTAPTYPVLPIEFAEACELQAQAEGFDFRVLACSVYIGRQRNESLRQQYRHVYELCGECSEASMELRAAYLALKNSIEAGKWLN